MRTATYLAALAFALAGCGRLGFDASRNGLGDDDGDAAMRDGGDVGPTANRVFVTRQPVAATFGGLAGGDAICAAEATAAGLEGSFVAWLSTSIVDARSRIAGSRGWVRADDEPVADSAEDLLMGRMLHPIDHDAFGQQQLLLDAWTGSDETGTVGSIGTCTDWTSTSGSGQLHDLGYAFSPALGGIGVDCAQMKTLMCFEVGKDVAVAARAETGRHIFVSTSFVAGTAGRAAFDAACAQDATTAGLPGTYLAAVATPTESIASRFTTDARPWVRTDGTRVADGGSALFDTRPRSFADQRIDGVFTQAAVWAGAQNATSTGTSASTCTNWSGTGNLVPVAYPFVTSAEFWGQGVTALNCTQSLPVLCLEN